MGQTVSPLAVHDSIALGEATPSPTAQQQVYSSANIDGHR